MAAPTVDFSGFTTFEEMEGALNTVFETLDDAIVARLLASGVSAAAAPVLAAATLGAMRTALGLGNVNDTSDANKPVSTAQQAALDLKASIASVQAHTGSTSNPHSVTKAQVGLGSADNTSDADKPVSTAQQAALDLKASIASVQAHTDSTSNPHSVTKAQVGLGNVDNTADANKPVSTAQQTALDGKAAASHGHAFTAITGRATAAQLPQMANARIKGRTTTGTGDQEDLTVAQVKALLALAISDIDGLADAIAGKLAISARADEPTAIGGTSTTTWLAPKEGAALVGHRLRELKQEFINHGDNNRAGAAISPGDSIWQYTSEIEGDANVVEVLAEQNIRQVSEGRVYRIDGAGTAAMRVPVPLEKGRLYEARVYFERSKNTADPANDAVEFGISWLDRAGVSHTLPTQVTVAKRWEDLTSASQWIEWTVTFSRNDVTGNQAFNTSARAARAFIRQFGSGAHLDVRILTIVDVSDAEVTIDSAADAEPRLQALENNTAWTAAPYAGSADLDLLVTEGLHTVTSPTGTDLPGTMSSDVLVANKYVSGTSMVQRVSNLGGSTFRDFARVLSAGTWSEWRTLVNTDDLDALEGSLTAAMPVTVSDVNTAPTFTTDSGSFTIDPGDWISRRTAHQRVGNWCSVQGVYQWQFTTISSAARLIVPLPYDPVAVAGLQQVATVSASGNMPRPTGWTGMAGFISSDAAYLGFNLAFEGPEVADPSERGIYSIASDFTTGVTYSFAFSATYEIEVGP